MTPVHPIPPPANDDPATPPATPPWFDRYKLIIGCCIAYAVMVIFQAIPVGAPPELRLNLGSSLSSLNISISHSKLITVEYARMKLLLSFEGQLGLSRPSLVSTFTQTSVRAKAQLTLTIVIDLGVNSLVSMLNGRKVTVHVAAKARRRLRLGPWWVAVFDMEVSRVGLTFTAPTENEGSSDRMILAGTLICSLNLIPQLWWSLMEPVWFGVWPVWFGAWSWPF